MVIEFSIVTDTATLAIFDLKALRHRMSDTSDWWSIQKDELFEMNEGNVAFLNLGSDGQYQVKVVEDLPDVNAGVYLKSPSGEFFVGAGEDATGGGLEPDGSDAIQGCSIKLNAGSYLLKFERSGGVISLAFLPSEVSFNEFSEPVRLKD
ncbi:DUF6386 family protein [Pseudomonas alkylphenolica]|uniref:DUF6386 family protein n=1 Tax=Pseudomonas alkylphenolica TaxID=237609 RepID=UPI00339B05C5